MRFAAAYRQRKISVTASASAALVVCALIAGCVYVPTAGHALEGDRGAVSSSIAESFKPRETTRADVLLALGRPSLRRENDRFFIYEGRVVEGYLFFGAGYTGTWLTHRRTHILVLEFTPENRFLRMTEVGDNKAADARARVEAWISDDSPGKQTVPDAKSEESAQ